MSICHSRCMNYSDVRLLLKWMSDSVGLTKFTFPWCFLRNYRLSSAQWIQNSLSLLLSDVFSTSIKPHMSTVWNHFFISSVAFLIEEGSAAKPSTETPRCTCCTEMIASDEAYRNDLVLLVKRNPLILFSYFHRTFMFLLLVSVTFYWCIE